jgi:hypothetical protein
LHQKTHNGIEIHKNGTNNSFQMNRNLFFEDLSIVQKAPFFNTNPDELYQAITLESSGKQVLLPRDFIMDK